jgi:DNA-directed RNA polymerase specialized sigma24 family protein
MHEVDSLTAVEIASLLDVDLAPVQRHMHRARRILEMGMEAGYIVSIDACGLPVFRPRSSVLT